MSARLDNLAAPPKRRALAHVNSGAVNNSAPTATKQPIARKPAVPKAADAKPKRAEAAARNAGPEVKTVASAADARFFVKVFESKPGTTKPSADAEPADGAANIRKPPARVAAKNAVPLRSSARQAVSKAAGGTKDFGVQIYESKPAVPTTRAPAAAAAADSQPAAAGKGRDDFFCEIYEAKRQQPVPETPATVDESEPAGPKTTTPATVPTPTKEARGEHTPTRHPSSRASGVLTDEKKAEERARLLALQHAREDYVVELQAELFELEMQCRDAEQAASQRA